jgi:hypothetical protein
LTAAAYSHLDSKYLLGNIFALLPVDKMHSSGKPPAALGIQNA